MLNIAIKQTEYIKLPTVYHGNECEMKITAWSNILLCYAAQYVSVIITLNLNKIKKKIVKIIQHGKSTVLNSCVEPRA
jgi:hypothetical protein